MWLFLPLYVLPGSEANRTARQRPIPEEQPVISTTFLSMEPSSQMFCFNGEQLEQCEEGTLEMSQIIGGM